MVDECLVKRFQLAQEYRARPAIDDNVMEREQEDVVIRGIGLGREKVARVAGERGFAQAVVMWRNGMRLGGVRRVGFAGVASREAKEL